MINTVIDNIENKIENLQLQNVLYKIQVLLEVSYFARNMYEKKPVISELFYIEDLIFLENNIVWFPNSLDVQSTDNSVELYSILSYSRFFL